MTTIHPIIIRRCLACFMLVAVVIAGAAPAETVWTDADTLTVEGRAFPERAATWDRLPAAAEGVVRQPVWDLSRDSAGIAIRFVTDSTAVAARTEPLVRQIRAAHPNTPIVLVEDRAYANNAFDAGRRHRNAGNWKAFRAAYDRLVADGVRRLFYLEGADLLGDDGEGTVDGSHPNDLGFMRQADAFEPVLRQALRRSPR